MVILVILRVVLRRRYRRLVKDKNGILCIYVPVNMKDGGWSLNEGFVHIVRDTRVTFLLEVTRPALTPLEALR